MKTALLTLAAIAGLVVLSSVVQAAPPGSHSYHQNSYNGGRGPRSAPSPVQITGLGHNHSHSSHHGGSYSNQGYGSHYPSKYRGHFYNHHHSQGSFYRGNNGGYGYSNNGIGISGRNFSFYYGF